MYCSSPRQTKHQGNKHAFKHMQEESSNFSKSGVRSGSRSHLHARPPIPSASSSSHTTFDTIRLVVVSGLVFSATRQRPPWCTRWLDMEQAPSSAPSMDTSIFRPTVESALVFSAAWERPSRWRRRPAAPLPLASVAGGHLCDGCVMQP